MKFIAMIIAAIFVAFSTPTFEKTFAETQIYDTIVDSDFLHSSYDKHESIYSIILADHKESKNKKANKVSSNDDSNNDYQHDYSRCFHGISSNSQDELSSSMTIQ